MTINSVLVTNNYRHYVKECGILNVYREQDGLYNRETGN